MLPPASPEVASSDNDGNLNASLPDGLDLLGKTLGNRRVDSIGLVAHEGLARELEQHAAILDVRQAFLHSFEILLTWRM